MKKTAVLDWGQHYPVEISAPHDKCTAVKHTRVPAGAACFWPNPVESDGVKNQSSDCVKESFWFVFVRGARGADSGLSQQNRVR